jgi:predicted protein tyrosine phosphatase
MKRLKICGRHELAEFAYSDFTHMVSIGDFDDDLAELRLPGISATNHLILSFVDTHQADQADAPSPDKVAPLFAWLKQSAPIERLLVHCAAGLGRSPAIALLTLCALEPEISPSIHLDRVIESAESAPLMPNVLVTQLGETLLSRGDAISSTLIAWRKTQDYPFED